MNGLNELRKRYPWPSVRLHADLEDWSLDGGGKELVLDIIRHRNIRLMVEVGAFVGGSAKIWLQANPSLTLIAIDPWEGDWWVGYARQHGRERLAQVFAGQDGPFEAFASLLWDFRDRVIPMRGRSPGVLEELNDLGIRPGLFFLDSNKSGEELGLCQNLFPGAALTGDDWTWEQNGAYPIRAAVKQFAGQRGLSCKVLRATWVLYRKPLESALRLRWLVRTVHEYLVGIRHKLARAVRMIMKRSIRTAR